MLHFIEHTGNLIISILFGILHNCIAHPLLTVAEILDLLFKWPVPAEIEPFAWLANRFHDWTAKFM